MSEYTTAGFGATINGKHTWKDYGLVIGNTDIVSEPSPKTNYIEVPGSSIRIDLTETLTGQVEYEQDSLARTEKTKRNFILRLIPASL